MAANTRTSARKTNPAKQTADTAPARKPARRAPAKKAAAAKKAPAKQPADTVTSTAVVVPVKAATEDRSTVVDTRPPLTVRRRLFTGPMGANEQAAVRAALASAALRLPIPVRTWNGSQAQLADGTLLIHNPSPDRIFTAQIACRHGAIHNHPIRSEQGLREARAVTKACDRRHSEPTQREDATYDWDKAITRGVGPITQPKAPIVLAFREGIHRANSAAADTQPMSRKDIDAGLEARATAANAETQPIPTLPDEETAKEHLQP
ncbi:hypothetical protein [Streptomyces sp. NPDC093269]|uniref:hypothetical protein n=1 Tax=Streptomyces sp. NPDC093269 TaxID=3366038 RepID=UPI0037F6688B